MTKTIGHLEMNGSFTTSPGTRHFDQDLIIADPSAGPAITCAVYELTYPVCCRSGTPGEIGVALLLSKLPRRCFMSIEWRSGLDRRGLALGACASTSGNAPSRPVAASQPAGCVSGTGSRIAAPGNCAESDIPIRRSIRAHRQNHRRRCAARSRPDDHRQPLGLSAASPRYFSIASTRGARPRQSAYIAARSLVLPREDHAGATARRSPA